MCVCVCLVFPFFFGTNVVEYTRIQATGHVRAKFIDIENFVNEGRDTQENKITNNILCKTSPEELLALVVRFTRQLT